MQLSTWADLEQWVNSTFTRVASFGDGLLRFDYLFEGEAVPVRLCKVESRAKTTWVFVCLKVSRVEEIPPMLALDASFKMLIGSFFAYRGELGIGERLPLRNLDVDTMLETIEALAGAVPELRRQLIQVTSEPSTETFDHFSD